MRVLSAGQSPVKFRIPEIHIYTPEAELHIPEIHLHTPEIEMPSPSKSVISLLSGSSGAVSMPTGTTYVLPNPEPAPQIVEVAGRAPNRIVEILELGYEEFEHSHPLPAYVRQAVRMTLQCRTSALGGHVERCPDGHIERVWYNCCGHRFCPRCAYRKQQKWVEQQRQKLLPVLHFHATFTIPHEFNELWLNNPKTMANLLFRKSAQAVQELLGDPQRVGVEVGITSALHTWNDQLLLHPHVHCLVTGGGLTPEGEWRSSWEHEQQPFLIRVEPVMWRFRRLFCEALSEAVGQDELELPQGQRTQQVLNMIHKVNRTNWDVYISKPPQEGGPTAEEVLDYLKKAVAGGPLTDVRIEKITTLKERVRDIIEGQEKQLSYLRHDVLMPNRRFQDVREKEVTFRWGKYDPETGRRERDNLMTLTIEECIRRLLLHVPPPDSQRIRHYGLYASAKQEHHAQCRELLACISALNCGVQESRQTETTDLSVSEEGRIPFDEYLEQRRHCPVCGKKLTLSRVIPASVTGKIAPRQQAILRSLSQAHRRGG